MLKRLWTWISRERNRQTLAWLGGAVVVIAGALWKIYTYDPPAKRPAVVDAAPKPSEVSATQESVNAAEPAPTDQSAKADHGGIAINADGNARVSVQQPTSTP